MPIERFRTALEVLSTAMEDPSLEPDPDRSDWSAERPELEKVADAADEALDALDAVLPVIDDEEIEHEARGAACQPAADAGALLHMAGNPRASAIGLDRPDRSGPGGHLRLG